MSGTQLAGHVGDAKHDGVTGVWYGKAPGLDRATDALRHANMIGTSPTGGAVALVGDDPAAKSSTLPCSSEMALAGLMMPTFYPADPAEALLHGLHAVELSRASGLWSAMKVVTAMADGASTAWPARPGSPRPVGPPWRPARLRPPAARPPARRRAGRARAEPEPHQAAGRRRVHPPQRPQRHHRPAQYQRRAPGPDRPGRRGQDLPRRPPGPHRARAARRRPRTARHPAAQARRDLPA